MSAAATAQARYRDATIAAGRVDRLLSTWMVPEPPPVTMAVIDELRLVQRALALQRAGMMPGELCADQGHYKLVARDTVGRPVRVQSLSLAMLRTLVERLERKQSGRIETK